VRDIEHQRPEIFRCLVLIAYIDGKITLSKAAELLGLSRMELQKELQRAGIPMRSLSEDDVAAEVEMLKRCC
jgi:predicted HTH domain antitoxin